MGEGLRKPITRKAKFKPLDLVHIEGGGLTAWRVVDTMKFPGDKSHTYFLATADSLDLKRSKLLTVLSNLAFPKVEAAEEELIPVVDTRAPRQLKKR